MSDFKILGTLDPTPFPLKPIMTKRLRKITKIYLSISVY